MLRLRPLRHLRPQRRCFPHRCAAACASACAAEVGGVV
ncbi:hypothetical protein A2U01_0117735 [Trifolium medium]|uniref:Uncharacterized protein n=1 Tax=Trifolium medium TaxID=97028 RepID=A0A392WC64_9FABA|nr:hypothetical protein [Trifolium medium]